MCTELGPSDAVVFRFSAATALDGLRETLIELGRVLHAEGVSAHREPVGMTVVCYVWSADEERAGDAAARFRTLAHGPVQTVRLKGMKRLAGASWGDAPSHHYVVQTDAAPGWDDELQRWYDEEHLAGLAAVPGNGQAQRLLSRDHSPRYYACYDLVRADVLGSPAWLSVRHTAWCDQRSPTRAERSSRTCFAARSTAAESDCPNVLQRLGPQRE